MSKTHDEFKGLVKVSEASEKRSKRGMMSKVLDPAGMHTDTTQPVIKGSGFKMTGFPQHSGVSPVKQVLKEKDHFLVKKQRGPVEKTTYVRPDTKSIGPKNRIKTKTKTKVQKFLDKHPKINDGLDKVKNVATKILIFPRHEQNNVNIKKINILFCFCFYPPTPQNLVFMKIKC